MREIEIHDYARQLLEAHGAQAIAEAAQNAIDLEAKGEEELARTWRLLDDIRAAEELALLQSFADQAVIAIENARLSNETKEALEQQKASAGILSVISNSVADTQPVFDEILHSIEHLFGGEERFIFLVGEDGLLHIGAAHGRTAERARTLFPAPLEGTASEVAIRDCCRTRSRCGPLHVAPVRGPGGKGTATDLRAHDSGAAGEESERRKAR